MPRKAKTKRVRVTVYKTVPVLLKRKTTQGIAYVDSEGIKLPADLLVDIDAHIRLTRIAPLLRSLIKKHKYGFNVIITDK